MTPARPIWPAGVFLLAAVGKRLGKIHTWQMQEGSLQADYRAVLAVAIGGAAGSLARYGMNIFVQNQVSGEFPAGTLIVNVSGSILLGFLMRFALDTTSLSPEVRLLLTTGFCGGYTTFSTFSYDTLLLLQRAAYARASLYVLGNVVLSISGAALGFEVARRLVLMARKGAWPI